MGKCFLYAENGSGKAGCRMDRFLGDLTEKGSASHCLFLLAKKRKDGRDSVMVLFRKTTTPNKMNDMFFP